MIFFLHFISTIKKYESHCFAVKFMASVRPFSLSFGSFLQVASPIGFLVFIREEAFPGCFVALGCAHLEEEEGALWLIPSVA